MDAWLWVLLAVAYLVLFFWLGIATLRNGHGWLTALDWQLPVLRPRNRELTQAGRGGPALVSQNSWCSRRARSRNFPA
jgi:hypothetical protein